MSLFENVMLAGLDNRREAIREVRQAAELGATRIPDTVLFGYGELSDTAILQLTAEFFEGKAARDKAGQS